MKFKVIFSLIVIIGGLLVYLNGKSTYRFFKNRIEISLTEMPSAKKELITDDDLATLPTPVKKYLQYVGVVGTEKVRNFSVKIDGQFKMSVDKDWAPVVVEQMSFIDQPIRLFFMKLKFMGMNIIGLHHYESAEASMVIKILDLIKVADARGPEMNKGETVTVFNDMCVLAPSSLIDSRITWTAIDDLTAKGTFTNEGISITATLYFNETGQLIDFVSDDRYYWNEDNTYDFVRWSTPLSDYKKINGLNLATYGEAVWLKDDGPYSYARFNIKNVTVNPGL